MTTTASIATTRKATPMEQWHNSDLRARLSCGHRKCDDGTLRVGRVVYCSIDCGSARVVREGGRVAQ